MADNSTGNKGGSQVAAVSLANLIPYEPGQSGNPGGKSLERERLRKLIADKYGESSIEGIGELATNARSEKVKLAALQWLAEQTVGKAVQAISGENGEPIKLDIISLVGALKRIAGEGE